MNRKLSLTVQLLLLLAVSLVNCQESQSATSETGSLSNFSGEKDIEEQEREDSLLSAPLKCTPGCQSCSSYGCIMCLDGYYLETNLTCVKCPMKECVTCASNGCLSCPTNYFLFNFQCIPCQQKNCPTCNGYGCTSCYDGFYLNAGVCVLCQEHCRYCNAFGCETCKDGYYWDGKTCTLRCNVPNCQTCDRDGDCVVCQIGYTLNNYRCYLNKSFLQESN